MTTPTGQVEGTVVDAAGQVVAGATVAVVAGDQPFKEIAAISGEDGSFRFGGMLPGTYVLRARLGTANGTVEVATVPDECVSVEIAIG